jgi:hypothetical protein
LFLAATSVVGSRIGWISPAFTFTMAGQLLGGRKGWPLLNTAGVPPPRMSFKAGSLLALWARALLLSRIRGKTRRPRGAAAMGMMALQWRTSVANG